MAHYAKIVYGKVTTVIVAEAEFFDTFVDDSPGTWVQTSYNTRGGKHYAPNSNTEDSGTPIRKNFAAIGMNYDGIGFYDDSPFPSWIFNKTTYYWDPPVAYPDDGNTYMWNESLKDWVQTAPDWPKEDK
tara:strand:- start:233 stop:619 length:387 start_codon:yes stop_codon:yes gene_type:complete